MRRLFFMFYFFLIIACNSYSHKGKQTKFSSDLTNFLLPGNYNVEIRDQQKNSEFKPTNSGKITITASAGIIEFKADDACKDLDSVQIVLVDSTLIYKNQIFNFFDTMLIDKSKSELNENYIAYAFGIDNDGGILAIPEFRPLIKKEDISGEHYLFMIGKLNNSATTVIRVILKEVKKGEKVLDTDKIFLLQRGY